MNVRTLKDNAGAVFSPKVSTDSVYLSGSKTTLTTKLSNIDNSISGKADSFTVSSSENTAAWGKSVTVGTVAGTDLKFVMPANPDTDTTYESKTAASGGTDVSLVTTGEKYTWDNKANAFTVSSSNPTAEWSNPVVVGTVAGTELKFTMPAIPASEGVSYGDSLGTIADFA